MPVSARTETVRAARSRVAEALAGFSESPQLDAELLLREVLEIDRVGLLLAPERQLSKGERDRPDPKIHIETYGCQFSKSKISSSIRGEVVGEGNGRSGREKMCPISVD